MGTRSAIGIEQADGSIRAIYAHWDGYLSNNGRILLDNYDRPKTLALMDLGDISSLGKELGEKHDFDDRSDATRDWCKVYGRDRAETDCEARSFASMESFLNNFGAGAEYYYVLRLSDIWQVSIYQAPFMDLFDAVREDAETEAY